MQYSCSIEIDTTESFRIDLVNASFPTSANLTYVGIKEDIEGKSNNNCVSPIIFNNSEIEINNRKFNILGNVDDINNSLNNEKVVFRFGQVLTVRADKQINFLKFSIKQLILRLSYTFSIYTNQPVHSSWLS